MKKVLSVLLSLVMIFSLCSVAFAGSAGVSGLKFSDDGKFKIMQINDVQDVANMKSKTKNFIKAALESEKPDLVVLVGDNLSDTFVAATKDKITKALNNIISIMEEYQVPFAATVGNHDHDLEDVMSIEEQMAVFEKSPYFVSTIDSPEGDAATYTVPIYSSKDASKVALNVYMMDTNNKSGLANGYEGCRPEQVEWYTQKCNELKAANGGKVVPSMVFQHVPVSQIYEFLIQVPATEANRAVFSLNDYKWYVVNEDKITSGEDTMFGEAPCSEVFTGIDENGRYISASGQYNAWVENGDIIGAFFAHDHVNSFVGKTSDGITLGYNGGTGFNAYGNGDKRSIRVFEFDENDVADYTTRSVYYKDLCGSLTIVPIDIASTAIFGDILRFLLRLIGVTPWEGK